jgi:hypothetical protein
MTQGGQNTQWNQCLETKDNVRIELFTEKFVVLTDNTIILQSVSACSLEANCVLPGKTKTGSPLAKGC